MKFFRRYEGARIVPGAVLDDGAWVDLASFGEDFDEVFFGSGGVSRLESFLASESASLPRLAENEIRYAPCVARPSKIVCVGLNYRSHALEMKSALPSEPKLFMKATTALAGMSDDLVVPRGSIALDYEVELAIIMGRVCRYVSEADAKGFVAGYTMMNDYSEREFQKNREGQWVKGKSADTFAPLGPCFVLEGRGFDPDDAKLELSVNGELRQSSATSDLIFGVSAIVSSVSKYMTLLPGDVISTGTPGGVGMGFSPPRYLNPGDVVSYAIDGIGRATQRVVGFENS